jgi:shikimate kinase
MKKDNIVLIGMPGSGKSTIGVVLAKRLGYDFVDSDLVIQGAYHKTLEQLIEENGDAGFIQIENDINKSLEYTKTVIATGGSVVYGSEAMEHLKSIGTIVYLKVSEADLNERLGSLKERGVVSNGKTTVKEIFDDRRALYEKYAEITVNLEGKSLKDSVLELAQLL